MENNKSAAKIIEAYKNIGIALSQTVGEKRGAKTIVVTSPSEHEGKTTTAINIAVALSQTGKRAVLIDSDMRNGTIHKKLRLSSSFGLYDLLKNRCELMQAITTSGSLDIIVAGGQVGDPEELLFSDTYENLISGLKYAYDYIIIDSASICDYSDTIHAAKCSDGVVLVVREGKSLYKKIDTAINKLNSSSIKILGSVINASAE